MLRAILLATLVIITGGCVTLTSAKKELYDELVARGEPVAGYPNPTLSGILSILPGGGQFANEQVGLGLLNGLLWPLSIVWAMPSAIKDAAALRKIRTVDHYRNKKRLMTSQPVRDPFNPARWRELIPERRLGNRRLSWLEQWVVFKKKAHPTFNLGFTVFHPYLNIKELRSDVCVGIGTGLGFIAHPFSSCGDTVTRKVFLGIDADLYRSGGTNGYIGEFSLGIPVGIGDRLFAFFRPALSVTRIRFPHRLRWYSIVGYSIGARFDLGAGIRVSVRSGFELRASYTALITPVAARQFYLEGGILKYNEMSTSFVISYSLGYKVLF